MSLGPSPERAPSLQSRAPALFQSDRSFETRDLSWSAAIALVTVVFHVGILRLSWMYDDPFHLHFLLTHPLRFLIIPKLWRQLGFRLYTPLQFVSYSLDLHLFGVTARGWYVHQLVSVAVAAWAFFFTLRLWWTRLASAAGALTFAINPYIIGWSGLLMARHYIEGLAFACTAVTAYVLFLRKNRPVLLVTALALYAAAILSKEVFVLLPFVMILLPEARPVRRFRTFIGFVCVVVVYIGIRYLMLGMVGGGYGWVVPPEMRISFFAMAPWRVVRNALEPAMLWIPVVAATVVIASREPRLLAPIVGALVAVVLPVLPVSTDLQPRYLVLPALIGALTAVQSTLLLTGKTRVLAGSVLAAWIIAAAVLGNHPIIAEQRSQSAESRFFQQLGPNDVLAHPGVPAATLAELEWLKTYLHRQSGTSWFYDDIYLCDHDVTRKNLWKRVGSSFVVERPPPRQDLPCRPDERALSIDILHEGHAIFWHLGPYTDGRYEFVLGDGSQRLSVPRSWGFYVANYQDLTFRVRYASPSGWVSYSPVLKFDFAGKRFVWHRP